MRSCPHEVHFEMRKFWFLSTLCRGADIVLTARPAPTLMSIYNHVTKLALLITTINNIIHELETRHLARLALL